MILCALVIGHKRDSPGSKNFQTGITEFEFNNEIAVAIQERIQNEKDVDVALVYRETYSGLPNIINNYMPDFIISLHANEFNMIASGTEVLYYHKSVKGREIAEILQRKLVECLDLPDRGVKGKNSESSGGYLLRNTLAPCIIAEPFFIDNEYDLLRAREKSNELIGAYTDAIIEIAKTF